MKILSVLMLFACISISAQEYQSLTIFNLAGVTGDTIRPISIKTSKGEGVVAEIDFTSVNCDSLELDFGYGLTDEYPLFLDTIPYVSMPVTLDKTEYVNTFKGVSNSSVSFDIPLYSANYLWFKIGWAVTCTSGEVKLRYKR